MITIGIDPHKATHTAVAIRAGSGEVLGDLTEVARVPGYERLFVWSRELDTDVVWAIEDCRHVSRGLERFLRGRGERVVRVPPKLMAQTRHSARTFGKSDRIDALAVARAALAHTNLPDATEDTAAMELRLLTEHRTHQVSERSAARIACAGTCTTSGPTSRSRPADSTARSGLGYLSRKLARAQGGVRVQIMRELVSQIRRLTEGRQRARARDRHTRRCLRTATARTARAAVRSSPGGSLARSAASSVSRATRSSLDSPE